MSNAIKKLAGAAGRLPFAYLLVFGAYPARTQPEMNEGMRTLLNVFARFCLSTSIFLAFVASPGWAQKVYTSVPASSSVVIIDGSTNTVVGSISVPPTTPGGLPSAPSFVALTPDAKSLYVLDKQSSAVDIIDTASDALVASIPGTTAGCPAEIVFSPDGLKGYLTDPCNQALSTIDTTTRTLTIALTNIPLSQSAGLAISPDGSKVYLGLLTGLGIYDTATQTFTSMPLVPPGVAHSLSILELAASADGTQVFAGTGSTVYAFETASATFVSVTNLSCTNGGIDITPDGANAFVGDMECGGITEIHTSTGSSTSFTLPDNFPLYFAFASNSQVGYASGANSVQVFGVNTNASIAVIPVATTSTYGISVMPTSSGALKTTSTTLASSLNPSTFGNAITFTANVTALGGGTPTRSVTFFDGATSLGSSTLSSSGSATLTVSSLATGTHAITATYGGDTNFALSTSAPLVQTVNPLPNPLPTTISLSVSTDPSTYGQNLAFAAQVSSSLKGITGTVTFTSGAMVLGKANLVGGIATAALILPDAGMLSVIASYSGDSNFSPSTSVPLTLTVNPEPTSCSIGVTDPFSPDPTAFLPFDPASVSVTVFRQYLGSTIRGSESASDNGVALVEIIAEFFQGLLTPGIHVYTGSYNGDGNSLPSQCTLTLTVGKASTSLALSSSSNPSVQGGTVVFSATVMTRAPVVPVGNVIFSDGGTQLAIVPIDPTGTATYSTSSLSAGVHAITANYGGNQNFLGSAANLNQTVSSSGGSGGGGGTCACTKTGNYVDPVAGVRPSNGMQTTPGTYPSPNGKYLLNIAIDNANQNTTLGITLAGTSTQVLPIQTLPITAAGGWGFSPDSDRFVIAFEDNVGLNSELQEIYVYDLTVNPARAVVHTGLSTNIGPSLAFSPSGRYFVYSQGIGQSQAETQIYRVQGVTAQDRVFDSGVYSFAVGSGIDSQTVGSGFSPDNPETSYVYSNVTGQTTFQLNLVNLTSGQQVNLPYNTGNSGWQYSPCADVLGVVWQPTSTQTQVDLYDTSTGKTLQGSGAVVASLAASLQTTSSGQQVTYITNGQNQTTLLSPPTCNQLNTPVGSNVDVTPRDASSATSPVNVMFASVTQAGQTNVTVSNPGTPPPSNFQLGNPAIFYDLTTTAIFSGGATVCINYGGITFSNQSAIRLFHLENGAWLDRTTSVNTATHTVCGSVSSFSPFALFEQEGPMPANLVASSGTPQTAGIFGVFPILLQATVTDSTGNPVSGVVVSFRAPTVGATGIFSRNGVLADVTTDASGVASAPLFTANGKVGNYTVSASVSGVAASANFLLTNSPAATTLGLAGPTTSPAYGSPVTFTGTVATTVGTPTGTVSFSDGGNSLGVSQLSGTTDIVTVPSLSAGVHFITASYIGDNSFSGSNSKVLAITVNPAPLRIGANNASRQYGQANPSLKNVTYNGFVNSDGPASLSGTLNCTTTATQASPVGTYPIICSSLTSENYVITFAPGTLTITPAVVTIAANNTIKVLNALNPALTWTASGFVNGDTTSVLTANPTCSTTALINSPVGSYPITCAGASATNYTFSYGAAKLKVQYAAAIGHVIQTPINADGSSVFNQGRTIPAKFSVYDANGVSVGTPGVVSSFFLTGIVSGTTTTTMEDIVDTNNPDTSFRWDGQEWIFNIATANLSGGSTYIYTITLNDGSTIVFQYGLR
jgi:Bacterial Ig-like domain (group 3)/MBG domain (YGX type)